jgi:hypothetical protein
MSYILIGKTRDGRLGVYTGRAGEGWFSENWVEAWPMAEALANMRCKRWNENTALHGITWQKWELLRETGGAA